MGVDKLLEIYRSLSEEDRELFDRGRRNVLFEIGKKKLEKKRQEIAQSIGELVDKDSKPYISTKWIKKNILGINEND